MGSKSTFGAFFFFFVSLLTFASALPEINNMWQTTGFSEMDVLSEQGLPLI